jgi:hypothetical protein
VSIWNASRSSAKKSGAPSCLDTPRTGSGG